MAAPVTDFCGRFTTSKQHKRGKKIRFIIHQVTTVIHLDLKHTSSEIVSGIFDKNFNEKWKEG
jgi:hypothetical protein